MSRTAHARLNARPNKEVVSDVDTYDAAAVGFAYNEASRDQEHGLVYAEPLEAEHDRLKVLLGRIADGDDTALGAFYDATATRAYALAWRILRDERAAEDAVSDAYMQVWQQASRYDPVRGQPLAWLLTICRSRALDRLRRRDRAEPHPEPGSLRPDLHRDDRQPLDVLLAVEKGGHMHAALAELGQDERWLIGLAFFRGMSHQEIAASTGMPLGSVKTVLRRALHVLREHLKLESV